MWNLKDSSKSVGVFIKIQSFQKHLNNLKSAKSMLSVNKTKPWRPTFILSQNKNRYNKNKTIQIKHENEHLLKKIKNIDKKPKINTLIDVPYYIPSNKQNYKMFKQRQRQTRSRQISKQNESIYIKISSVSKSYDRKQFQNDWKTSRIYKRNLSKKHQLHDFRKLAQSRITKLAESRAINLRRSVNVNLQFKNIRQQNFSKNSSMVILNNKQMETNDQKNKVNKFF